jgi:hypothetical protein
VSEPDLTYPSHPFSAQLCIDIAALPLGLSDIALEARISEQIIEVLCRLSKMAQTTPLTKAATTEQIYNTSIDLMTYATRSSTTPIERSICLFAFVFLLRETPSRNESQWFYGQFLVNLRRQFRELAESFMGLDGVTADLAMWGVAMFAMDNSEERVGLTADERSDVFARLLVRYPSALNWKQTWKSLKRFFFLDAWKDEYRVWWDKEILKYKSRPQER